MLRVEYLDAAGNRGELVATQVVVIAEETDCPLLGAVDVGGNHYAIDTYLSKSFQQFMTDWALRRNATDAGNREDDRGPSPS